LEELGIAFFGTLLLAGVSGLTVGAGAVAASAQFPLRTWRACPGRYFLAAAALMLLATTALLLVLWIFVGPSSWAPKIVMAGLGVLAGPPLSQCLPGKGLEGKLGLGALLASLLIPGLALTSSLLA